jgi:hypothetical protein
MWKPLLEETFTFKARNRASTSFDKYSLIEKKAR